MLFPRDIHHTSGYHMELTRQMPSTGRILDLGCGVNTDLARYRTPKREVWGTDFQAHSTLQHADWFRLLDANGTIPFPDQHFDLVASAMVMEHVADPAAFFGEIRRILRPGGRFVAHTISGIHYVTWIRRIIGLMPHRFNQLLVRWLYGRECEDTFPTHYALNSKRRIRQAGHKAGLQLAEIHRYADPGYFQFFAPFQWLAVIADRCLECVCPGWGRLYLTVTLVREEMESDFTQDDIVATAA